MSFINKFKDATIGFSGYARLGRDRAGGFGYMAVLLLIVLAISATITTVQVKRGLDFAARELAAGPDFSFRDGEVHYEGPMPKRIEEDGALIIIDTTGQTSPDAIRNARGQAMLITKTKYYQKDAMGRMQEQDLSALKGLTFTKQDLIGLMGSVAWFIPVGYLLVYVGQLGFKALDALILGLVALMWGSATGRKVPFDLGFKLGLYAMTLPIIIQWIFPGFTTLSFAGFGIWWGLAIVYLIMGLRAYYSEDEVPPFYEGE